MTEISLEAVLIIIGISGGSSIAIELYILKRLNYTCNTIAKIVTFLKIKFPNESRNLFD